jgi:hypothetical protein
LALLVGQSENGHSEPSQDHDVQPRTGSYDPITGISAHEPTIVMISLKDEACCDLWWVVNEGPLRSKGWTLHEVNHVKAREYPSFRIYFNGKWRTHEGPLYKSHLAKITAIFT